MKVIVTGATGFIGRRLCDLLLNEGYKISAVSRKKTEIFRDSIVCDLEKETISSKALEGITTVFHLAGYAHDLNKQLLSKDHYTSLNIDASVRLAKQAAQMRVKKFIFVSSVKAGGSGSGGQLITESTKGEPEGIYGKTKREAEIKLLEIGNEFAMEVTILRPSLVYGPKVKGNLSIMMSAIENGWFPPLPKLNNTRSMIHVDDVVRALLFLARNKKTEGEIYIATDGEFYSASDIYEILSEVLGKRVANWRVPVSFFRLIASLNSNLRYKVNKIFSNEAYSSLKLQSIGFQPTFTLREINEKAF